MEVKRQAILAKLNNIENLVNGMSEFDTDTEIDVKKAVRSPLTISILQKLFRGKNLNEINDIFYDVCYFSYLNNLDLTMLQFCVENGAAIDQPYGSTNITPFSLLCFNCNINKFDVDMLKYCLLMGSDLNRISYHNNTTPYYYICHHNINGKNTPMLEYLKGTRYVSKATLDRVL